MTKKTKYSIFGIIGVIVVVLIGCSIPFLKTDFQTTHAINAKIIKPNRQYIRKESYNPFTSTDSISLNTKGVRAMKKSSDNDIQQAISHNPLPSVSGNSPIKQNYLTRLIAGERQAKKINPKLRIHINKPVGYTNQNNNLN